MRVAVIGHVEHVTIAAVAALPREGEIVHLDAPAVIAGGGGGIAFAQLARGPGDVHLFTATLAGERGVFTIDRDSPAPKRVAGLGSANIQHVSLTGDQVVFVENGRAGAIKLPANSVEYFDIADRIRVSLRAQSEQKFLEASRIVGTMWSATVFGPVIQVPVPSASRPASFSITGPSAATITFGAVVPRRSIGPSALFTR